MELSRKELEKTVLLLKDNPEVKNVCEALQKASEGLQKKNSDTVEAIDHNQFFARVIWQEEDIRTHLEDKGYEVSDENVNKVLQELDARRLVETMIEAGWEIIYEAVQNVDNKIGLKREGQRHEELS